jgi:hypothetical protein
MKEYGYLDSMKNKIARIFVLFFCVLLMCFGGLTTQAI